MRFTIPDGETDCGVQGVPGEAEEAGVAGESGVTGAGGEDRGAGTAGKASSFCKHRKLG